MTQRQIKYAAQLWVLGCDTIDMSRILREPQAVIHNWMDRILPAAKLLRGE